MAPEMVCPNDGSQLTLGRRILRPDGTELQVWVCPKCDHEERTNDLPDETEEKMNDDVAKLVQWCRDELKRLEARAAGWRNTAAMERGRKLNDDYAVSQAVAFESSTAELRRLLEPFGLSVPFK